MMEIRLGDFVKIKTGKLNANAQDKNGTYPFFTCAKEISRINTYAFDCECVLVAGNGVLNAKYYDGKFNAYQRVYIIEVKDKEIISTRFLFYFIDKYMDKLRNGSIGGIIKYIKLNHLTDIKITLPDLPTQNKIVALLDKASALVQKREKSIALLDELLRAQFLEMFGDPVLNPHNFNRVVLKDYYFDPKKGTKCGPFGSALKKTEYTEKGIPVWNMDNISKTSEFKPIPNLYITNEKFENLKTYETISGDIIVSRAGTVGKMAIVNTTFDHSIISTNLIRIRFGEKLLPQYFISLMKYAGNGVGRLKRGADGAFTHMNTKILDSLEFPYPPLELQQSFLNIFENFKAQKDTLIQSKTYLENLYQSLLQRAFSGQLNFNVDIELDALLAAIDIEAEKNDIKDIATVYAGRLLERIEEQSFENQLQYQQAKQVVFQMLEEGIVEQAYEENTEAVKLKLV